MKPTPKSGRSELPQSPYRYRQSGAGTNVRTAVLHDLTAWRLGSILPSVAVPSARATNFVQRTPCDLEGILCIFATSVFGEAINRTHQPDCHDFLNAGALLR